MKFSVPYCCNRLIVWRHYRRRMPFDRQTLSRGQRRWSVITVHSIYGEELFRFLLHCSTDVFFLFLKSPLQHSIYFVSPFWVQTREWFLGAVSIPRWEGCMRRITIFESEECVNILRLRRNRQKKNILYCHLDADGFCKHQSDWKFWEILLSCRLMKERIFLEGFAREFGWIFMRHIPVTYSLSTLTPFPVSSLHCSLRSLFFTLKRQSIESMAAHAKR